jgi:hypothetical protein
MAPPVQEPRGRQACIQTGEERRSGRSDRHCKRGTSRRPASIGYGDGRARKKADHRHRRLLLSVTTAANSLYRASAFRDGVKEPVLIDGYNVAIAFRWAENKPDRACCARGGTTGVFRMAFLRS